MDLTAVMRWFKKQKVVTVVQLASWLSCSVVTARRRLKILSAYTSYNRNGRYYTLPEIAQFDDIGLWLASTLSRLHSEDWQNHSMEFAALLESFVVQQLIGQAGWVDSELRFSHYRDKNQVEVDLVIEQGRRLWGVEVKRAASIQKKDGVGLAYVTLQGGAGIAVIDTAARKMVKVIPVPGITGPHNLDLSADEKTRLSS